MAKFTAAEYFGLDEFIKHALQRVETGRMSADEAHSQILHVVSAYDRGNDTEVVPYMNFRRSEWLKADSAAHIIQP